MKTTGMVSAGIAFVLAINFSLHAQNRAILVQPAQADSLVSIVAESQGLQPVSPADLPIIGGTFWWVMPGGAAVPAPCPPQDLSGAIYQIADGQFLVDETGGQVGVNTPRFGLQAQATSSTVASTLATQVDALVDMIAQIQTAAASQQTREMARTMGMDVPIPDDGGNNNYGGFSSTYTIDPDALYLEITNVSGAVVSLNLHNGTNFVYCIWSTTNLATPFSGWQVETELWPTNQAVAPFTVPVQERTNLFLWAWDWTGITSGGNQTPEWWFWKFYHTTDLSDTNLDSSQSNTLLWDYQNGIDPNIIQFSIMVTNLYVSSTTAAMCLNAYGGAPSYEAVLVDSTEYDSAHWTAYTSSNITVNLGSTEGQHTIWIGLRGLPPDAQQTWQKAQLILDTAPPVLVITNPPTGSISQFLVQVQGYSGEPLSSLTYDISNAAGICTNQAGHLTGQFYDAESLAYTTNCFDCSDVFLDKGLNSITFHATDLAGNTTATNLTLDCFGNADSPMLAAIWPQDGTYVSGSHFTFEGQANDPTITVIAQIVDADGHTNTVPGLVEQSGLVWVQNLPLAAGGNTLTLVATDGTEHQTTNTLTVVQSSVTVSLDTLSSDQWNKPSVYVTGTVSDPTVEVFVNGVQAMVNDDGTWEADKVPVSAGGTAAFDVEVYSGSTLNSAARSNLAFNANDSSSSASIGSQLFTLPQPLKLEVSYSGYHHDTWTDTTYCWGQPPISGCEDDTISWNDTLGGTWQIDGNSTVNGDSGGSSSGAVNFQAGDDSISPP
jgi:hypothetical protein